MVLMRFCSGRVSRLIKPVSKKCVAISSRKKCFDFSAEAAAAAASSRCREKTKPYTHKPRLRENCRPTGGNGRIRRGGLSSPYQSPITHTHWRLEEFCSVRGGVAENFKWNREQKLKKLISFSKRTTFSKRTKMSKIISLTNRLENVWTVIFNSR